MQGRDFFLRPLELLVLDLQLGLVDAQFMDQIQDIGRLFIPVSRVLLKPFFSLLPELIKFG